MTDTTTDLPPAVRKNWEESFHDKARATTLENELPALDAQIARAKAHLEMLCKQHADKGREITAYRTSSELHRELVELWCSKHSRALPAEPAELSLTETRELPPEHGNTAAPPVAPCMENPPRHDACTGCACPHHQAETDALTDEQTRVHNILGTGPIGIPVAGQTTQTTRTDHGGEAPGNGRFPGDPDA
jgi:hypothetical protein